MTVPADEPQTRSHSAEPAADGHDVGVFPLPAPNAAGGGGAFSGLPTVPVPDDDTVRTRSEDGESGPDAAAHDSGERELGASDGPVGGTPVP